MHDCNIACIATHAKVRRENRYFKNQKDVEGKEKDEEIDKEEEQIKIKT